MPLLNAWLWCALGLVLLALMVSSADLVPQATGGGCGTLLGPSGPDAADGVCDEAWRQRLVLVGAMLAAAAVLALVGALRLRTRRD